MLNYEWIAKMYVNIISNSHLAYEVKVQTCVLKKICKLLVAKMFCFGFSISRV